MKNSLTTFYIIRHGQTDWNKQGLLQGTTDIPLNDTGEEQAKKAAKQLKDVRFDLFFSSDLFRAKRTAEIIALEHKLAVEATEQLRERRLADFEGKPSKLFHEHIKTLATLSHDERLKHKVNESSESDEEVIARIFTFLRETAIAYPGKTILVATHGGVLHTILLHLGIITYKQSDNLRIKNGGYLKLTSDGIEFFIEEKVDIEIL